ncbi:MAG TPA: SRPBCC family protein, partial [Gemmatimonadaceae bacterium]|nr:SRPBCC family protein [Gemmatimonadaceae bacterium]
MSLRIEETFRLQAPPDRVWAYLVDPRQVVTCLPGAELTAVESETTFLGKVKVKVGPVVAAYSGKVVITERDDAARVVKLVGEGRESGGAGSAKMTMTSTLAALPDGGTEVRVVADLDIVGKLVQFGRGMIESVNKQLFKQFTDCVRATLEAPAAAPAAAPTAIAVPTAEPSSPAPAASGAPPATATATAAAPTLAAPAMATTAPATSAPTVGAYAPPPAMVAAPRDATSAPLAKAEPVRLLPLVLRALW